MVKRISGFTIVELLIVMVVIAILTTISTVTYNGVQQQARNTKIMSGVRTYEEAFGIYLAKNDKYPHLSYACLGANYPSGGQCWRGPGGNFSVRTDLDTELKPYLDEKPELATKELHITTNGDYRLGAVYIYTSQTNAKITYYLEGQGQKCLDGNVGITEMEGTQCQLILPPNNP